MAAKWSRRAFRVVAYAVLFTSRMSDRSFGVACTLVLGVSLVSSEASASGISVARFGGELGTPMTTNATSIFYNPSGFGLSEGGHVFLDVDAAWRHASYDRPPDPSDDAVPAGGSGANDGEATLFNLVASPFAGVTYKLGPLGLALAYYTPYGGMSSWDENDAFSGNEDFPGAVDGVQRWYSIEGELISSYLSLGVAYDFGNLSFGVSGNLIRTVANTIRARDPSGGNDLRAEGRSWLDVSSIDLSAGAGLLWEPKSGLRLGVSYQSRPGFTGGIVADGKLTTLFASGVRDENDVEFHTDLPDVVRAGVSYRASEVTELRLFGDYQRWSVLENHCISPEGEDCEVTEDGSAAEGSTVILNQVRNWDDTFGIRAGVSYWAIPSLEVLVGGGFATTAAPDETVEPALMDFDSITAALGARLELSEAIHVAATYTQFFYIQRDIADSIHPDLTGATGVTSPSRGPSANGEYAQQVGTLDANIDIAF